MERVQIRKDRLGEEPVNKSHVPRFRRLKACRQYTGAEEPLGWSIARLCIAVRWGILRAGVVTGGVESQL